MAILELDEATVRFGGLTALDNVSVHLDADAITGLIGPNGSGKSTLINMVSGQVHAASGSVTMLGKDITGARAHTIVRHGLARTFQVPRVPKNMTIADILAVPMTFVRLRERHAALSTPQLILEFCGIEQTLNTKCSALSTPELRRLEIARGLACAPKLLLLDEVMASLPANEADAAIAIIRAIRDLGICVAIVEHVLPIITGVCDTVLVLDHGKLLTQGTPSEVLANTQVQEAYLGRKRDKDL